MKPLRIVIIVICFIQFGCKSQIPEKEFNATEIEKSTFVYKKVGDVEIEADFYRIEDKGKSKPVIIWIHPGALIWGSKEDLPEEQMRFYLERGYSIISINHRLAPTSTIKEIITDIQDAIEWVKSSEKDLSIDRKKVYLVGHSAGAYLSLLAGSTMEQPPNAIISFYGYGDILADWAHLPDQNYIQMETVKAEEAEKMVDELIRTNASFEERFNYYVYCRQNGIWANTVTKLNRIDNFEDIKQFCPSRNINRKFPPTLLIHGDKDTDVPFSESIKLSQVFKVNNIQSKLIEMKGYGHVFDILEGGLNNEEIVEAFDEIDKFLKKH